VSTGRRPTATAGLWALLALPMFAPLGAKSHADHAKLNYHLPVTNAARILARMGIKFELRDYQVDEEDLSAENVASKVGLPLDQVWKTLVVRGDRTGVLFAVLAGSATLDLKALAKLSGNRKTETVPLKEVQPLTGYIRGGVTAIGGKKDYPVFVDETIELFDVVAVSAGVRGTQILDRARRLPARGWRHGGCHRYLRQWGGPQAASSTW
jgi:Cys-tRNA(Pro)/Cys-tRNA(Cys) deacylase